LAEPTCGGGGVGTAPAVAIGPDGSCGADTLIFSSLDRSSPEEASECGIDVAADEYLYGMRAYA
jgi:hypothetical protein